MRNIIITAVILSGSSYIGHAQFQQKNKQPFSLFPKTENPYRTPTPLATLPPKLKVVIPKSQSNTGNAVILNNPLTYAYNNQKGFDVYKSNIDGMPVLMPDKENRASLGMVERPKTSK